MLGFEAVILILTLIVFCSALAESINIPYPIVLLILGFIVGFFPEIPQWAPPRDILIPLFLPPILFRAALATSMQEFRNNIATIASLGVVLVLITSVLVAVVLSTLMPDVGFMPALLLGAIISPSDSICATSIFSRLNISPQITGILESESLINDATGIVLYNFALANILFQESAFSHPLFNFFSVAIGGILLGIGVGLFFSFILNKLMKHYDASLPMILSLVIPYLTFYLGHKTGVSGVLAVVAAGMSTRLLLARKMDARSRLISRPVWDTVVFALNGMIFILLGLQVPRLLEATFQHYSAFHLITLSSLVILTVVLVRIAWVYLSSWIFNHVFSSYQLNAISNRKENFLIGWSGMRGIVSLALALSVPELLHNNAAFPERNLILLITVLTILFTVLVQGLLLPVLVKLFKIEKDEALEFKKSIQIIELLTRETINQIAATDFGPLTHQQEIKKYLLSYYQNRLHYNHLKKNGHGDAREDEDPDQMIIKYYQYEREKLFSLYQTGKIDIDIFSRLLRYLDVEEARLA